MFGADSKLHRLINLEKLKTEMVSLFLGYAGGSFMFYLCILPFPFKEIQPAYRGGPRYSLGCSNAVLNFLKFHLFSLYFWRVMLSENLAEYVIIQISIVCHLFPFKKKLNFE